MFAYDSYDWDFLQGVIDDGQLRALPLENIADYPNIEALLARNQRQQVRNQAIYSIPRPATALQATPGGTMAFYYRLDWADTLDITVDGAPNWEEFWRMLSAFAHNDPDGDWNNNTWGLTLGGNLYEAFLMPFGVRDFVLESGTWQLGLTSARARRLAMGAAGLPRGAAGR